MLTHGKFVDMMRHALGKTPDARFDLWNGYNNAARRVVTHFLWSWRTAGPVDIAIPSGATEFTLPGDFHSPRHFAVANYDIRQVSIEDMLAMRADGMYDGGCFYLCFDTYNRRGPSEPAQPRALIYPTPTSGITLQAAYYSGWVNVTESEQANRPSIPDDFEYALTLACRAVAQHIENQTEAFEDGELKRELERLEAMDRNRLVTLGPLGSGMPRRRASGESRSFDSWSL